MVSGEHKQIDTLKSIEIDMRIVKKKWIDLME